MIKENLHIISQNLIWMTVFLFPIAIEAVPGFLCLFGMIWLYKQQYKNIPQVEFKPFIAFGIFLFLLNVVGLSYSEHIELGKLELESKLTFAILPLVILTTNKDLIGNIRSLMIAFILGCALAGLICIAHSVYAYVTYSPWVEHFFGARLSVLMHLGFFAFYLNFAMILGLKFLLDDNESKKFKQWMRIVLLFIMALIILTTSKMGIILLLMILTIFGVSMIRRRGGMLKLLGTAGVFVVLFSIAWFSTDYFSDRFKEVYNSTFNDLEEDPSQSTSVRRVAWGGVTEIIKKNALIGVGTGDVKPELFDNYKRKGYTSALEKEIGPHNQYLQTFAEFGAIGLVSLLLLILYPIKLAIDRRNFVLLILGVSLMVACITESILERQAGVLFFNFFFPILLYYSKQLSSNDSIFTSSL